MNKEVWNGIKWGLLALVCLVLLGWGLMATNIISFGIQREAIQHSQPYVETKISLLHKLHSDWLQLGAEIAELKTIPESQDIIRAKQSQQKGIIVRMSEEAELLPDSQVPQSIVLFLARH